MDTDEGLPRPLQVLFLLLSKIWDVASFVNKWNRGSHAFINQCPMSIIDKNTIVNKVLHINSFKNIVFKYNNK